MYFSTVLDESIGPCKYCLYFIHRMPFQKDDLIESECFAFVRGTGRQREVRAAIYLAETEVELKFSELKMKLLIRITVD